MAAAAGNGTGQWQQAAAAGSSSECSGGIRQWQQTLAAGTGSRHGQQAVAAAAGITNAKFGSHKPRF